jgi:hypothetical protein
MAAWDVLRSRVEQGLSLETAAESYVSDLPDAEALVQMICASWTPALQRLKPDSNLVLAVIDTQKAAVQRVRGPQGTEYVQALVERLDAAEAKLQKPAADERSPA